jgi:hypothetical protein
MMMPIEPLVSNATPGNAANTSVELSGMGVGGDGEGGRAPQVLVPQLLDDGS